MGPPWKEGEIRLGVDKGLIVKYEIMGLCLFMNSPYSQIWALSNFAAAFKAQINLPKIYKYNFQVSLLCHLERTRNVQLLHSFRGANYFNVLASKDLKGGSSSAGN